MGALPTLFDQDGLEGDDVVLAYKAMRCSLTGLDKDSAVLHSLQRQLEAVLQEQIYSAYSVGSIYRLQRDTQPSFCKSCIALDRSSSNE